MSERRAQRAFTLLEVLVALAIFATVAGAVLASAGRSLNNAARLESLTLAGWIADNRLTELQLLPSPPAPGRDVRALDYANRQWQLESLVETTSEPGLLRVTLWVAEAAPGSEAPRDRALTSLTGFIEASP